MPALVAPAAAVAPRFAEPVFDVTPRTALAKLAPAPVDYAVKDKRDGRWLSEREIADLVKKAAMPAPTAQPDAAVVEVRMAEPQRTVSDQGTTGSVTGPIRWSVCAPPGYSYTPRPPGIGSPGCVVM